MLVPVEMNTLRLNGNRKGSSRHFGVRIISAGVGFSDKSFTGRRRVYPAPISTFFISYNVAKPKLIDGIVQSLMTVVASGGDDNDATRCDWMAARVTVRRACVDCEAHERRESVVQRSS